jgi:hypothetical protein
MLETFGLPRLGGGGCSLAKPVSVPISLVTGKLTGIFVISGPFQIIAAQ